MLFKIYLMTVLFDLFPQALERTIISFMFFKDGFKRIYTKDDNIHDIANMSIKTFISFLFPFNIISGIKAYYRLFNIKAKYTKEKFDLLRECRLYRPKDNMNNEETTSTYLLPTLLELSNTMKISEEDKEYIDNSVELYDIILRILDTKDEDAIKKLYELDNDLDYENAKKELLSILNGIKDYGENLNKSKLFSEMTTKEKIQYLRREREDLLRIDQKEKILKREKKNGK